MGRPSSSTRSGRAHSPRPFLTRPARSSAGPRFAPRLRAPPPPAPPAPTAERDARAGGRGGQTSKAASSTQSTLLVAGVIFVLGFDELLYVLQRPLLLLAILAACLAGAPRPRPAASPPRHRPLPAADARAGARRAQRRGTTWCTSWRTGRPSSRAPPRASSPRCPRAARRRRRRATRPQPRTQTSRTPLAWQGRLGASGGLRRTPAAGTIECCPPARLHSAARRAMYASSLVHRGPAKARETPTAESKHPRLKVNTYG